MFNTRNDPMYLPKVNHCIRKLHMQLSSYGDYVDARSAQINLQHRPTQKAVT